MHEVHGNRAVYGNNTPAWHRIGQVLDGCFTAEQAIQVINPDRIPVESWAAGVQDPVTGEWFKTNEFTGTIVKEDGKVKVFDFPSPDHKIVQDWEQMAWMDAIVGAADGAHYEAAVKLRGGTQTALTINLGEVHLDENGRNDVNYKYLFGFNSHNRSWQLGAKFANIRGDCANCAAMILGNKTAPEFKTKHTTNIMNRVALAQKVLGLEVEWSRIFFEVAEELIQTKMSDNDFQRLLDNVFVIDGEKDVEATETTRAIYMLSPAQSNLFGTWWGGFNAVTYYNDWNTVVRGSNRSSADEMRFFRQFDDTKNIKQRAWDATVEMAGL